MIVNLSILNFVYGNPSLSRYDIMRSLRSLYSTLWVSKNFFSFACSNPVATASWRGLTEQNTVRVRTARMGTSNFWGAIHHPTRHPVAEKDLPAEPTVMVRSHKAGDREAIRTWGSLKVRQSYLGIGDWGDGNISGMSMRAKVYSQQFGKRQSNQTYHFVSDNQ